MGQITSEIRGFCLQCVEGTGEVRRCAFFACPLWPFRMNMNPFRPPVGRPYAVRERQGSGVSLDVLRGWAGRNLAMETVEAPDPREMTVEELDALGCKVRSPAKAAAKLSSELQVDVRRVGRAVRDG